MAAPTAQGKTNEATGLNTISRLLLPSPSSSKPVSRQREEGREGNPHCLKKLAWKMPHLSVCQAARSSESAGCYDPAQKAAHPPSQAVSLPAPEAEKRKKEKKKINYRLCPAPEVSQQPFLFPQTFSFFINLFPARHPFRAAHGYLHITSTAYTIAAPHPTNLHPCVGLSPEQALRKEK